MFKNIIGKNYQNILQPLARASTSFFASHQKRFLQLDSHISHTTPIKPKRVCDILMEYIHQEGVEYVFGVTGKAISPVFDAVLNFLDMKAITARHEGGAAFMACGYAQATGRIGVCCGTAGGGSTNLTTGVASAYMNSLPMLVITGQVPTMDFGKSAFQESTGEGRFINVVDMFKSMTKHSTQILTPQKAPEIICKAIRLATTGRNGPVHLNIPADIQMALLDTKIMSRDMFLPTLSKQSCDMKSLQRAIDLIKQAKKPVFLLGWGAIFSNGCMPVIQMAEQLNIPIATTPQGKGGIAANHPLCLGVMGLCGHETATNYIFNEADLLIAVGTTFNEFDTFNWDPKIAANKKIIQIDIDPTEIGKNYPVDVGLIGDAKTILEQLLQELMVRSIAPKLFQHLSNDKWDINKYSTPEKMFSKSIPLNPQRVMKEIRDSAPDNTVFAADSGSHMGWTIHTMPIYKNGKFFPMLGLGSMGSGICSVIGMKLANPDAPVICICGDGSFQMNGNEIGTAAQYNIPVIWVIFNDKRFNMPYSGTLKLFGRGAKENCELKEVDFVKFASSFGIKGYCVRKPGELEKIIPEAIALKQPVVIDVHIDPNELAPVGGRLKYGGGSAPTSEVSVKPEKSQTSVTLKM